MVVPGGVDSNDSTPTRGRRTSRPPPPKPLSGAAAKVVDRLSQPKQAPKYTSFLLHAFLTRF